MSGKPTDVTRPRPLDDVIDDIISRIGCGEYDARRLCMELVQSARWDFWQEIEAASGTTKKAAH